MPAQSWSPARRAQRLETVTTVAHCFPNGGLQAFIEPHARQAARQTSNQARSLEQQDLVRLTHILPGKSPKYVLNQLIDTVLASDKEFVDGAWHTRPRSCQPAKNRQQRNAGPFAGSRIRPAVGRTGDRRRESMTRGARHFVVCHAVLRRVTRPALRGDRCASTRTERPRPAAAAVPASGGPAPADARGG